jgi:uncharacterized protein (DUF2384 family)
MSTHLRTRDLPSDPSEIAHFLSETVGLEDDEIATMTGVSKETASRWLHTEQTPRGGDALRAVVSVIQLLGEPATAGRARDFLRAPNAALQHRSPIEALGERGEARSPTGSEPGPETTLRRPELRGNPQFARTDPPRQARPSMRW